MILAIGNAGVYEMDMYQSVLQAIRARGSDAILFKQDRCLEGDSLTFEVRDGQPMLSVVIDGIRYDASSFSGIWYMHPQLPRELLTYEPADHRHLIHRQFQEMRQALWSACGEKRWLNDPFAAARAENKILQLRVATAAGLTSPNTLVASDPKLVRAFAARCPEGIVVKLLAVSPIYGQVIYTNRLSEAHLTRIDSVRFSPAIFQALVPKAYELRITIVGDRFFTTKILSQNDEATALDWRRKPLLNDYVVRMETAQLPEEIQGKLLTFMRALGLRFGCIDMIVTPSEEHVFLEVNPNGQWYFVQLRTGHAIAEAIADILVGS